MSEGEGGSQVERFNAANIYRPVWVARKTIGYAVIPCVIVALVWIATTQRLYMASTLLAAAPSNTSSSSSLGGLAGAARLAGISGLGASGNNQFIRFQALMTSYELAEALAKEPGVLQTIYKSRWDEKTHSWKRPSGGLTPLKTLVKSVLGMPTTTTDPNAEQLESYLETHLNQSLSEQTGLLSLTFKFSDPIFARNFLGAIHRESDNILRNYARARSQARIAYLKRTLPTVTLVEQRQVLIELLNEEEQTSMTIESDPNFAADVIDAPHVSARPIWPNPPLMFGLSLVAALFIGMIWHHLVGGVNFSSLRAYFQRLLNRRRNKTERFATP